VSRSVDIEHMADGQSLVRPVSAPRQDGLVVTSRKWEVCAPTPFLWKSFTKGQCITLDSIATMLVAAGVEPQESPAQVVRIGITLVNGNKIMGVSVPVGPKRHIDIFTNVVTVLVS
jgi:hypothetical protein